MTMPKPDLSLLDHLTTTDTTSQHTDANQAYNADNISTDQALSDINDELENTVLKLSDYLAAVQLVTKETFNHSVWVKAEIRNLSSKSGHYYFELAEKDDSGKVIASCRGNLWKFKASRILTKFEQATGIALARDVTVLLNVTATFHPLYGFSLAINDIDPSYTLGDLARQYAAMLERLSSEGLLTLNKSLPNPFDIEHVIVIAPENAAGLGDFRADADRLQLTQACHFHYHYATFQGNTAPAQIRHAITKGMLSFKKEFNILPDVMVIIRGGGAVGDLAYLNDYELAALIAEQPIPVWVGIGHEKDHVLLDEVAHTSFDTPSKVIAGIINHLALLMRQTQSFVDTIHRHSHNQLNLATQHSQQQFQNIEHLSQHYLQYWQHLSTSHIHNIQQKAKYQLREAWLTSNNHMQSIQKQSYQIVIQTQSAINHYHDTTKHYSQNLITQVSKQIKHYQQLILMQNPKRLLTQGYALVKNQQHTYITSVIQTTKGDFINIEINDGELTAVVTEVTHTDNTDTMMSV